jgi:2'-5' RNA ligase
LVHRFGGVEALNKGFFVSVLRFDEGSERRIREASRAIGRTLGRESVDNMAPHISLIPTDTLGERELVDRVGQVVAAQKPFKVSLSHFGWFEVGVLFLGVTPTRRLLELHRQIHEASSPSPNAQWIDLYKPEAWVPHCTLVTRLALAEAGPALHEAAKLLDLPLRASCQSVEVIEIAEDVLRSIRRFPIE